MKPMRLLVLLFEACAALQAAELEINSLSSNGRLTFTNAFPNGFYTVEWAARIQSVTNQNGTSVWPWNADANDSWDCLRNFAVTGQTATVEVPMFYRVRVQTNTYSTASLDGTWFVTFPYQVKNPYTYMLFDGCGTITDFGVFDKGTPAGYYSVHSDGTFALGVFVVPDSEPTWQGFFVGALDAPTKGRCWKHFYGEEIYRIDEGLCRGDWIGTMLITNGPPQTNDISFSVLPSGQITNFTGFAPPVIGRMLSDSNGNLSAFFWTGENNDDREIKIHGSFFGDNVAGRFRNDGDAAGLLNLSRQ